MLSGAGGSRPDGENWRETGNRIFDANQITLAVRFQNSDPAASEQFAHYRFARPFISHETDKSAIQGPSLVSVRSIVGISFIALELICTIETVVDRSRIALVPLTKKNKFSPFAL